MERRRNKVRELLTREYVQYRIANKLDLSQPTTNTFDNYTRERYVLFFSFRIIVKIFKYYIDKMITKRI